MKAVQISKAGGPLEIVERPIPAPPPDWVRLKVQACGVCHSDVLVKDGQWPGLQYPRIPGHEVAGVIDEIGANVTPWKKGHRAQRKGHVLDDRRTGRERRINRCGSIHGPDRGSAGETDRRDARD